MNGRLKLRHVPDHFVEVTTESGARLFRYVYVPDTPRNESRRPYFHPLCSLAGDALTNFRPNDHPWHHGLSLAITSVDGVNFWGGPSYRAADGYQWRDDHGEQRHRSWGSLAADRMEENLDWCEAASGSVLLNECRELTTKRTETAWSLEWTSRLENVSGRNLPLGNYHSLGGLAGSHYTGLQFRGARDLLDDHGDATIGIAADGGHRGEAAVHGTRASWMEWSCQHDGSLRRTRIRFEDLGGSVSWFVRAKNPIAAFAFQCENTQSLGVGETLRLHHRLTFTQA